MTFDNDFVILKLEHPLHLGNDVEPAHLPNSGQLGNDRCFVSGWGSLEPGTYTVLRNITHSKEFSRNQEKHQNFNPFILPYKYWVIFM